jgi:sugar lactone lactonase YvrE
MFVADRDNDVIREITTGGVVSVFAGTLGVAGSINGTGTAAKFDWPIELAIDTSNNIYVADRNNALIRKITPSKVVTTIAGTTAGSGATQFNWPLALAVTADGSKIYVADAQNNRIQKITRSGTTYTVSLLAGQTTAGYANGTGSSAKFDDPSGVALDNSGNIIVADRRNHCIRKVTSSGVATLLAGNPDSTASTALVEGTSHNGLFSQPYGVTVANNGSIFITDIGNYTIRRLSLVSSQGCLTTVAGSGTLGSAIGDYAQFNTPTSIAIDASGNLYVADVINENIVKLVPETRDLQYTLGWTQSAPYPGITWYKFYSNTFFLPSSLLVSDSPQHPMQFVNVFDIDLTVNHLTFRTHPGGTTITNIVDSAGANVIAAMSGTFGTQSALADSGTNLQHDSYLENNDTIYWSSNINFTNGNWVAHDGYYYSNSDGTIGEAKSNMTQDPFNPGAHQNILSGGPLIINNGEPVEMTADSDAAWPAPFSDLRNVIAARDVIALAISSKHVLLIAVDGVQGTNWYYQNIARGHGMYTKDLTQFIKQYFNAPYALNLDGGGTTTMCLMGYGDNGGVTGGIGVINYPDWDRVPGPTSISAYGQQRNTLKDAIEVIPN